MYNMYNPTTHRNIRSLDQSFDIVLPDAKVVDWLTCQLEPYRSARTVPTVLGGTVPPVIGTALRTAVTATAEYTVLETEKIQCACSLTNAQWDTHLPDLFSGMLEEGCTTPAVWRLLIDIFRPSDTQLLSTVAIAVSKELAKDVKTIDFAFGGSRSYMDCHRGLSPFTFNTITVEGAAARCREAERYSPMNQWDMSAVLASKTIPDPVANSRSSRPRLQ
jgi:hypothetical protein